jgi:uncharacterized RDD family membrane protein YckC
MDQPNRPDGATQGVPPTQPSAYPSAGSPPAYPPAVPPPPASPPAGPPPAPWAVLAEPAGPAPGVQFAGHGARLGAYILDAILVGFVVTAAVILMMVVFFGSLEWSIDANGDVMVGDTAAAAGAIGLFLLGSTLITIFALLYFPFFWARGGATPGMKVTGIRVVNDRDGSRIGWGAALLRLVGYWVSGAVFYIGFVWILIDSRRRGWHDLIAGTCVISTR